jgi:hypothetical protein
MGTLSGTEMQQKVCLEGDTDSEGKVKKALRRIWAVGLEPEGLHLGFLVNVVLAGVTEAVFKPTGFLCQRPDQALPGGEGFRLEAEGLVLKSQGSVDPLPAGGLESGHQVGKDKGVERVVVHQEGVADISAEDVDGQLAIKGSAVQKMRDEVIAIGLDAGVGLLCQAIAHAFVDVPVGGVDGDVAYVIAAFFEKSAKSVSLVGGVTFL